MNVQTRRDLSRTVEDKGSITNKKLYRPMPRVVWHNKVILIERP